MKTWLVGLFFLLAALVAMAGGEERGIVKTDLETIEIAESDIAGGQPSEDDLAALADKGFVAVIDLRGKDEDRGFDEAAAAAANGLEYTPLPIVGRDAINAENALKLGELLDAYDGPVLVHCGSSNRVGALVALLEAERGATSDAALEAGRAAGLTNEGLENVVRERLDADSGD